MDKCTACMKRQADEARNKRKHEHLRVNINPDCAVAKEIAYQTALLKEISHKLDDPMTRKAP